ncbi:hypothetical protein KY366_01280 [Candidatus Woesearchaeota archaeon]|nr:hypothetical protein [Candidatus Woesearchaeota archaeon]
MVETLAYCLGRVAPYYNLVLVIIATFLFLKLFKTHNKKTYIKPWELLFAAVLVYVGEEVITVLDMAGLISAPKLVFPLLETVIITLFIYALLLQKEHTKK